MERLLMLSTSQTISNSSCGKPDSVPEAIWSSLLSALIRGNEGVHIRILVIVLLLAGLIQPASIKLNDIPVVLCFSLIDMRA